MPGLVQRNAQLSNATASLCCSPSAAAIGSVASNGIWSKQRDVISYDQLQKFWSDLPPHARQELLRIDKQTLFEQARKNLYCSRCNGLLLEGFSQIVMYGKSLQQEGGGVNLPITTGATKNQVDKESDDGQDPSVHPWGGLAATRDGILTLLDCFLYGKSLRALQNVFDSARARERERELLYPDACGGGGRGWISQGMANYGRGHGTRETCALHTARLSCDTLVDFWSALGDETRLSLLRMKEEDFIERLMYRFDSKKFCRDCRRNVIREFKELKELKRMRRELRCTSWFCVADTAFQYEVSDDTVLADWHQSFTDTVGTYHHFEWAIGTGEGKSDILEFEDVGMNRKVQANGLDLGGLSACFITLRAWRLDGRHTEFTVKAHALKGQPCVHRRLVVGDGFVTIMKGESIRRFFEHAEEAEEEEDDDSIDKDGNELDGDGSHPQKHAKSPELAREFLLDAATVIFKEQVEKAFREGTARQNAHSIFVCLALKLLEERVHVACKEIITLEKQNKLLEEEEKEKREEEERKERRRTKEREKKLRRKERLKGKERGRERKNTESNSLPTASPTSMNESSMSTFEEQPSTLDSEDSVGEAGDMMLSRPLSPDIVDEPLNRCLDSEIQVMKNDNVRYPYLDGELNARDGNGSFMLEQSKSSSRKLRSKKDYLLDIASKWSDKRRSAICYEGGAQHDESDKKLHEYMMASSRCINGENRQSRGNILKTNARNCGPKFGEKFHCFNNRIRDRYDFHSCSCNQHGDYRAKEGQHTSMIKSGREVKIANKTESLVDTSRPLYRGGKYSHGCYMSDNSILPRGKLVTSNICPSRGDVLHAKQVWEPTDSRKKCPRSSSDPDATFRTDSKIDPPEEVVCDIVKNGCEKSPLQEPDEQAIFELSANSVKADALSTFPSREVNRKNPCKSGNGCQNGFELGTKSHYSSKDGHVEEVDSCPISSTFPMNNACDPLTSSSSSDNCSSCLSEGDSSTSSSSAQNAESSSTSDSEDAGQQSDGREISTCTENTFHTCQDDSTDGKHKTNGRNSLTSRNTSGFPVASCTGANFPRDDPTITAHNSDNGRFGYDMSPQQQHMLPIHNQSLRLPMFPPSTMGYHNQSSAAWTTVPANGMLPFPQPHRYMFPSPLGYGGLPTNQSSDFCMQYRALQPLTTPVLNVGQLPPYQTSNKANIVHLNEQAKNFKTGGTQEVHGGHPLERPFPTRQRSPKPQSSGENGCFGNNDKSHNDTPTFSLFHFGGPMAVAAGYNMNPVSPKEETVGDFSPDLSEPRTDHTRTKKETAVEEYSLFASSNGARFSFL